MACRRISCRTCGGEFENWNYGKPGRPPKYCAECKGAPAPARQEIRAIIDQRVGLIDNDEKQAVRDKFTAQCRSYLNRFSSRYSSFKAFSLAGALFPNWQSQ